MQPGAATCSQLLPRQQRPGSQRRSRQPGSKSGERAGASARGARRSLPAEPRARRAEPAAAALLLLRLQAGWVAALKAAAAAGLQGGRGWQRLLK